MASTARSIEERRARCRSARRHSSHRLADERQIRRARMGAALGAAGDVDHGALPQKIAASRSRAANASAWAAVKALPQSGFAGAGDQRKAGIVWVHDEAGTGGFREQGRDVLARDARQQDAAREGDRRISPSPKRSLHAAA